MDVSVYIVVLLLALLSGITTIIGVLLAIHVSRSVTWIAVGIGFSVGMMLMISLFELIPAALKSANAYDVVIVVGLGAGVIAVLDYSLPHVHLFKERGIFGNKVVRAGYLVVFGLILHDFPEGFAMANAYITNPSMGVAVALAIALHNIPEEFAMAVPAITTRSRSFLIRAAIISGLAEPIGASIGLFAGSINPMLVPLFMAFAAGAMIYISLHELVPMAKRYGKLRFFCTGTLASAVVYLLLGVFLTM